jgi:hypothetical protein
MIILTRDINEELDKLGLSELTIIRDESGTIQLAGKECSKPVTPVSTIKVGKKLTIAERAILTDNYIMPMLTTYWKTLQDLIITTKDTRPEEALELFLKEEKEDKNTKYLARKNYSDEYVAYRATKSCGKDAVCRVYYNTKQISCDIETGYQDEIDMKTELSDGVLYIKELIISIKKYVDLVEAVEAKTKKLKVLREAMLITCAV